jgi:hypothetical protein
MVVMLSGYQLGHARLLYCERVHVSRALAVAVGDNGDPLQAACPR